MIPGIDNDQGGVQVVARLSATLDRIDSREARREELQRRAALMAQPVFYYPGGTVVIASNIGLIDLGGNGPDMGHLWMVRSIVVGGLTPTTVTAGVADVFISAAELGGTTGINQEPSLLEWRDRANTLPSIAWYSAGEMVVKAGEHLVLRFSGATNGQQVVAAARVMDIQEGAAAQTWDLG